ncbi:HlyD family secretion protein [Pedobacter xixiisoli]|nr:HlyD family efflux transporter periplasmic adaptor subunit [Pedobacter xixiisoli]
MFSLNDQQLQSSAIVFLYQTRVFSQVIYTTTLLAIVTLFASLPFIYTTVSVKSSGLMQSNVEKIELYAPVSGKITQIRLKDNQKASKGTLLLSIDQTSPQQQGDILGKRKQELTAWLADAQKATQYLAYRTADCPLATNLYLASWQQFKEQQSTAFNAHQQALKIFERYQTLYQKKVVTLSEYEQYKFDVDQRASELQLVAKRYQTQWQTEAKQYQQELSELNKQQVQLKEQQALYQLSSPITGFIQNPTGLQVGSFVHANQKLCEISPDSSLVAFCYVKPTDIGLIKSGQMVRFQIDAFNYNQWGMLTGKVIDISEDIIQQNQTMYFKVKCKLDKNYLQLKNGYKGNVKKGMTLTANFTVAKRSLFQLLYDKVDDWVNPSIISN